MSTKFDLGCLQATESQELLDFVSRLTPQWLAGFFDGEGCISVTYNVGRDQYTLQTSLSQKNPGILAIVALKFPATIHAYRESRAGGIVYQVQWAGFSAKPFLDFIKDHLIIKKRHAALALEFIDLLQFGGKQEKLPEDNKQRRREIREELVGLNKEY